MARGNGNRGVVVGSGGRVGAVAVGTNARAVNVSAAARSALEERGLADVAQKLQALMHAINAHGALLGEREQQQLAGSAEVVASELSRPNPNKLTIRSVLEGIASSAGSVATIATSVEALKRAISALL